MVVALSKYSPFLWIYRPWRDSNYKLLSCSC